MVKRIVIGKNKEKKDSAYDISTLELKKKALIEMLKNGIMRMSFFPTMGGEDELDYGEEIFDLKGLPQSFVERAEWEIEARKDFLNVDKRIEDYIKKHAESINNIDNDEDFFKLNLKIKEEFERRGNYEDSVPDFKSESFEVISL